jgi:hypothetical protein
MQSAPQKLAPDSDLNAADALSSARTDARPFGRASSRALQGETPTNPDDPVARGREAWERRKADASFDDWLLIGEALLVGRRESMAKAKTNKPAGRRYNEHFGHWLQLHRFNEIDSRSRGELFSIMAKRADVETYRKSLTPAQRAICNHPSTVWRAFICPDRGNRGRPKAVEQAEPRVGADTLEQIADEFDEENAEKAWQRGLLFRARKAIGDAKLHGHWLLTDPPDGGLIAVVDQVIEAWTETREYLKWAHETSPEELAEARKGQADAQQEAAEQRQQRDARPHLKANQRAET